jgi:hypothetical protein
MKWQRQKDISRKSAQSGASCGAAGWGTALQAGRSRVRFPMVSEEFFIHMNLPAVLWPWGRLSLLQEWVQTYHLHVLIVSKSRCLKLVEPCGLIIGPYKDCLTLRNAAMQISDFDVIQLSWTSRYYSDTSANEWPCSRNFRLTKIFSCFLDSANEYGFG